MFLSRKYLLFNFSKVFPHKVVHTEPGMVVQAGIPAPGGGRQKDPNQHAVIILSPSLVKVCPSLAKFSICLLPSSKYHCICCVPFAIYNICCPIFLRKLRRCLFSRSATEHQLLVSITSLCTHFCFFIIMPFLLLSLLFS